MMEEFPLDETQNEDLPAKSKLQYPLGKNKIPISLEFFMTLTRILILAAAIFVAAASIVVKVTWLDVLIRTGVTIFVLGLCGFILNWFIGKHFIEATLAELKELQNQEIQDESNMQVQA
jgi:hypothetical protein